MPIAALYKKRRKQWGRVASSIVNQSDVEDVISEAVIKMLQRYSDDIINVDGWSYRIVHNTAVDFYRRSKYQDSIQENPKHIEWCEDVSVNLEQELDCKAGVSNLIEDSSLSKYHKVIVRCLLVDDWSYDRVSHFFNINKSTLRTILNRFRNNIKEI